MPPSLTSQSLPFNCNSTDKEEDKKKDKKEGEKERKRYIPYYFSVYILLACIFLNRNL